jgi:hypothetical protein
VTRELSLESANHLVDLQLVIGVLGHLQPAVRLHQRDEGPSGTAGAAPLPQQVSAESSRHWDSPPKRPKFPVIQLTVSLHLAIRHSLEIRSNRFV